jgi:hypothetical protein
MMNSDGFRSKVGGEEGTYYSRRLVRKVVLALMLVVVLGSFAAVGWAKLKDNWRSSKSDQGQYLSLGLEIREGTALTDGNRHPLYPALLALFAKREWAYFTKAKMLSLVIALVGLVVIYWMCHRMFGQDVALLTTLLLSVGYEFRRHSWMVMCEVLLIILFFAGPVDKRVGTAFRYRVSALVAVSLWPSALDPEGIVGFYRLLSGGDFCPHGLQLQGVWQSLV